MTEHVDAGELRERPEVLRLTAVEGGYEWQPLRRTWAKAELQTGRQIWSAHSVGADGVTFLMRKQSLTLSDALRWNKRHCTIVNIRDYGRNHIQVEAALVEVTPCEDKYTNTRFPAIVAEQYHRHDQQEPQAVNAIRHVLVTPKAVELKPGRLVEVDGVSWPILTAHTLDPYKNEYVIERVVDL